MAFKGIAKQERREHTWHTCNCQEGTCVYCGGGLGSCSVCFGVEGTLTTDCCGRKLTKEEERRIYEEGTLDFIEGRWLTLHAKKDIEYRMAVTSGREIKQLRGEVEGLEFKILALLGKVADLERHRVEVVDKVLKALYQKEGG